jgi:hypothetical protein
MKTKKVFDVYYNPKERTVGYNMTLEEANELMQREINMFDAEDDFMLLPAGEIPDLEMAYYYPSDSMEYYDPETNIFYNRNGQQFRDPNEYNPRSEGYTPFGDE